MGIKQGPNKIGIPSYEYNDRTMLQKPIYSKGGSASTIIDYEDVVEIWAQINPMSVTAQYWAQQITPTVNCIVRIRYRKGVTPGMRLFSGHHYYYVKAPPLNVQHRNVVLELQCQEFYATGE